MPLFKTIRHPNGSKASIWKIEEPESFFTSRISKISAKKNPIHALEFLASRFLLTELITNFQEEDLQFDQKGKPFLNNSKQHLSISHSFPYVAISLSSQNTGIDIQVYREKIITIQSKFLTAEEQKLVQNNVQNLTLAWTAKEAVFKWFGEGGLDFKQHMPIRKVRFAQNELFVDIEFHKNSPVLPLHLLGGIEKDFAWSFL